MVEKLLIKEATRDSNTVKVAIVEVVPFTEGDFNLVQGCKMLELQRMMIMTSTEVT